jgi:hypothetical protein
MHCLDVSALRKATFGRIQRTQHLLPRDQQYLVVVIPTPSEAAEEESADFPNSDRDGFPPSFRPARSRPRCGPIRKGVSAGSPETFDELPDYVASRQQAVQQALQFVAFAVPLAWDLVRKAVQLPLGESLDPRQPRIKVVPRFDPLIDIIEPIHTPRG